MKKGIYFIAANTVQGQEVVLAIRLKGLGAKIYWTEDIFDSPMKFDDFESAQRFMNTTLLRPTDLERFMFPIEFENINISTIAVKTLQLINVEEVALRATV